MKHYCLFDQVLVELLLALNAHEGDRHENPEVEDMQESNIF